MNDHPPIHSVKGVEYWDEGLQEYILDPTPDINTRPAEKDRTQPFVSNPVTTRLYGVR